MQMQAFNIILPKELVKKADKLAEVEYKNRSGLIREALIRYLEEAQDWKKIFAWGREIKDQFKIKSEADVLRIIND